MTTRSRPTRTVLEAIKKDISISFIGEMVLNTIELRKRIHVVEPKVQKKDIIVLDTYTYINMYSQGQRHIHNTAIHR